MAIAPHLSRSNQEDRSKLLAAARGMDETERRLLIDEFYRELLATHPHLASFFAGLDLAQQVRKLSRTLQVLIAFADDPEALGAEIIPLGIMHDKLGIGFDEYHMFARTLALVLARHQTAIGVGRARQIWFAEIKNIVAKMLLVAGR